LTQNPSKLDTTRDSECQACEKGQFPNSTTHLCQEQKKCGDSQFIQDPSNETAHTCADLHKCTSKQVVWNWHRSYGQPDVEKRVNATCQPSNECQEYTQGNEKNRLTNHNHKSDFKSNQHYCVCNDGYFIKYDNNKIVCTKHAVCDKTHKRVTEGTSTADTVCKSCEGLTASAGGEAKKCDLCKAGAQSITKHANVVIDTLAIKMFAWKKQK